MLTLQTRLALGCIVLCDLLLLTVGIIGYSFHARGLYNSVDRTLVTSVQHAEVEMVTTSADHSLHLSKGSDKLDVVFRLYDPNGDFYEGTPAPGLPPQLMPN